MGVTYLWPVLDPVKKRLPLSSLRGQRLAVDLSIWICESQGVMQLERVTPKPFLRNLFFRVSHLLHSGIDLVFIIDGCAPELKAETMRKRQNECFLYGKSSQNNFPPRKSTKRSHLNAYVKKCCELLDCLGVPYLESQGEAEAYCAFLNKHGVVDACITDDGDAFLYGAQKIYRNISVDPKDPHVESYTMQDIEQQLPLTQEKLVAFALLTGCDYQPKGIPQVGVETTLKLLMALTNRDVLSRFRQWHSMKSSDCCCGIERSVWEKACKLPGFPSEQIIEEFLVSKDVLPKNDLQWKSPDMKKFENFVAVNLEWPKDYAVQKILPLLTRWIMLETVSLVTTKTRELYLTPVKILKNRVCKGVQSVEMEWKISGSDENEAYVTVEDREMVGQCFPDLLEQFSQKLNKKTKTKPASRISSKTKKTRAKENSALTQQVLLLNMEGLTLKPNKAATQKAVKGASEELPVKREKHTGTFACEQVLSTFNEKSIRNCLSSVSQNEEPSSGARVTNLNCNNTESSEPDTSDDEYLPLKERIKNSCVQIQNHKPKKEMSRTSLLPSFTNSIKSEPNSETYSKSRNQIRNCTSVSMCSDQQTNTISHGASITESIDLRGKSYSSCPEIDSSNDEDSDDSLFLPVSQKLLSRYQISGESQNEDNFQSNQCLPLNSSQIPCDDSIKINHCERMEELNKSTEFSQKFQDNSAEHFDNSQLSKTAEITEQFFLLNVNEVEVLSSNHSGMVSMATLQQSKDTVERSFGTDAKQLCTDTVERSFSTDATQVCKDTTKRSFGTDATQLCRDTIKKSTDTTQVCTDIIKRSFSTDATQLCTGTVERSFSTDATQLCTDTVERSFSTDATQLCTDTVE
ncbi:flap endonuclease 1, partial [Octopus bimaculoides]